MRTLGLAMLGIALSCTTLRADDAKDMEGVWKPVEATLGKQKWSEEMLRATRLKISGDQYEVVVDKQADRGRLKLDPAAKLKALDIIGTEGPNKGKTILAIYELSGDTLRVCYALTGDKRPTAFDVKGEAVLFLVTYKRVK
jgi:uncharacterized protein (TIGR03067 family)